MNKTCNSIFLGHHACKMDGGKKFVRKNAPFLSEFRNGQSNNPFLGSGYYFWDDNLEAAEFWGNRHYKGKFYILKANIVVEDSLFLDLVGNRSDMKYIAEAAKMFQDYKELGANWTLAEFIELLKKQNKSSEFQGIFPFEVIRAIDSFAAKNKQNPRQFVNKKNNYTLLDPRIIICVVSKNKSILQNKQLT